ncbi:MAG: efflux RND transporter periplasmic adaptor subunit [Bacteroidota bacterium]
MAKKILNRGIIIITVIAMVLIISFLIINQYVFRKTVHAENIQTAIVDSGDVTIFVEADGVIEPANEVVILSPSSAVLSRIMKEPGHKVSAGEVIVRLDRQDILDQIESMQDQLGVMENNLRKNRLNARNIKIDLEYNVEVKKLKIASLNAQLVDEKQLLEVGGISPSRFDKTKQELTLAQKDLETLRTKNSIRLQQLEADEEGLLLQIEMQEKALENARELYEKMLVRAPSEGIVLHVNGTEGEKVKEDQVLITLSNLSRFKVKAAIDEKQSDLIKTGQPVYAMVENTRLKGRIGNINPSIENEKIQFNVNLEQGDHPKLRPNKKVKLMVVKDQKNRVVRLKRGDAIGGAGLQNIFVVHDGRAMKREINIGMVSDDFVEIEKGITVGDCVIISGVPTFSKLQEIEIVNR